MKPAPFKYAVPDSVEEAVTILSEYGDEAKVLAGSQSLIPLMNMRLARPSVLVDINRIAGLNRITRDGGLTVGALTRQSAALGSGEVRASTPLISEALKHVGHVGIRSRGTIGGSIAHADPAAELPTILSVVDGDVLVQGPKGERTIGAEDLFVTNFTTSLVEDEVLTQVRFPWPAGDVKWSFHEIARRRGDFALVIVAVVAEMEERAARRVRIALGSVADRPVRAAAAEAFLAGKSLSDTSVVEEAARLAVADLDPPSDLHASSIYRTEVARALVKRALTEMSS